MRNESDSVDKILDRILGLELIADEAFDCLMIRVVSVDMAIEHDSGLLEPNPFKCPAVVSYSATWAYIVESEELSLFPTFCTV
jgi:hypothetical protein